MEEVSNNLRKLYEENAPKITSYFIKNHLNALKYYDSYSDMQQSLLLMLWRKLPLYNETRGKFTTFAYCCCHNEIRFHIRKLKAKRRYCPELVSLSTDVMNGITLDEILSDEIDILEMCESRQRVDQITPLLNQESYLYYIKHKTQKEIAELENVSQSNIARKIKRNVKNIQEIIKF